MESLALIAAAILFFGIFGGLIALGLLKIKVKGRFAKTSLKVFTLIEALFSLVMGFSIAISSVAIVIRLFGVAGFGLALYAIIKIIRGENDFSSRWK